MLKRLSERLCAVTSDKYVHLLCCLLIAFTVTGICQTVTDRWMAAAAGFVAAFGAGVIKEVTDENFDWNDIKADSIGATLGAVMALL